MSRSIFGWDLPPGVTQRMIDEAAGGSEHCEICFNVSFACICPECNCGKIGDPKCYSEHGMTLTREQAIARQEQRITYLDQLMQDEGQYLDHLKGGGQFDNDLSSAPDPFPRLTSSCKSVAPLLVALMLAYIIVAVV